MKNTFLAIGIAIILLIGSFFALNAYIYNEKQADDIDAERQTVPDIPQVDSHGPRSQGSATYLPE